MRQYLTVLDKLVSIPSIASSPQELRNIISYCRNYFANTPNIRLQTFENKGIPSLLILPSSGNVRYLLNAHIDVVPGNSNQYQLKIAGDKAMGRGVYDMKGAAAVMMGLVKQLAEENRLNHTGLLLVTDEEVGGFNGTKYVQETYPLQPDLVIVGEPTELNICNEHKGILWLKITEKGVSAHGSRPWEGLNANVNLAQKISHFYQDNPLPKNTIWKTTYNLARLQGGNANNVVPNEATAVFDIRRIPKESSQIVIKRLKQYFPQTTVEVILDEDGLYTSPANPAVRRLQEYVNQAGQQTSLIREHYGSDARFYSRHQIAAVNFGPRGGGIHQDNEWVNLKSLDSYQKVLNKYLLEAKP